MNKHFRLYWLPVIIWAVLIYAGSSIPSFPKQLKPLLVIDEIPHMLEYAVFGFLLARAFANSSRERFKKNFRFLALFCVIVYGISDEWHQSFVPHRVACVSDVVFDALGGFVGQLLYKIKKTK